MANASPKVPCIPDYSTISRRVNKLDIKINEKLGNDIVIALDSTGIKAANLGEWMGINGIAENPCLCYDTKIELSLY